MRSAARTLAVSVVPAVVVAAAWLRLESPADRAYRPLAIVALALLPALVRPRLARGLLVVATVVLGAWLAFDVSPLRPRHWPGAFGARFSSGFLDFYDVSTPFDPRDHAEMRSVVLAAIFGFVAVLAAAVAARRPLPALLVLLVGAGWPATLRGSSGALVVGTAILLGVLVLLAGSTRRAVPRAAVPAAAGVALVSLALSTSAAVAKSGLVHWQRWDLYTAAQAPVSVSFAWNAQYDGIRFPAKRTTVLQVQAPPRSLFWRAAVLDSFAGDRWQEAPPQAADALVPPGAVARLRQDVHVLALSDTRLVGASVPLRFDAGDALLVTSVPGFASLPSGLPRGFRYTVWSYAPSPTAAQLARSRPRYPAELVRPGAFLEVSPGVSLPPFGSRGRRARVERLLDTSELIRYAPLARRAFAVAGTAPTPYAAAADLLRWFRVTGGFTYTNRPPVAPDAPLVAFVTRTHAGYCQHFAGAMALMLRYLGVPARVAVGFSSGTYDPKRQLWTVTDHDAHAWVEAWFAGYGWLPFDPTPAGRPERGELSAPYAAAARSRRISTPAGGRGTPAARGRAGAHRGTPEGAGARRLPAVGAAQHGSRGGSILLLLVLACLAAVATIAGAKLAVHAARRLAHDPRRVAGACRLELADYLLDQGIDEARSATLHELAAIVRHELGVDADRFVAAAAAARFGPPAAAPAAARAARRELRLLRRRIRMRLGARARARGLVSLRSLGFAG